MPEKICGTCRFIDKFETTHICSNPEENTIPNGIKEVLPSYPACDSWQDRGGWKKDHFFKTGTLA